MRYNKSTMGAILMATLLLVMGAPGYAAMLPQWQLADISGHLPDLKFLLVDDRNMPVSEETYKGDVILLYFGFTRCPAQCPMTMSRLSTILQAIGTDADKVHIFFVSVDPQDAHQDLHSFLHSFDPQHVSGLSGKSVAIKNLAKRYRAAYPPTSNSPIQHSNAIYIFDTHNHARLIATDSDSDTAIIHDVRQLAHAAD